MNTSSQDVQVMLDASVGARVAAEQHYMWQVVEGSVGMLALEEATARKELAQQLRHERRLLELLMMGPGTPPPPQPVMGYPPAAMPSPPPRRQPQELRSDPSTVSVEEVQALWSVEKAAMQRKINELRSRIASIELGTTSR